MSADGYRPAPRFAFEQAIQRVDMPARMRRTAVVIALFMDNRGGEARPGRRRLKDAFGIDQRTLSDAIEHLVDAGLIEVQRRAAAHGSNLYRSLALGFDEDGAVILADGRKLQRTRYGSADADGSGRDTGPLSDDSGRDTGPLDRDEDDSSGRVFDSSGRDTAHSGRDTDTKHPRTPPSRSDGGGGGGGGDDRTGSAVRCATGQPDRSCPDLSAASILTIIDETIRPEVMDAVGNTPIRWEPQKLIDATRAAVEQGATPAMIAAVMRQPYNGVKSHTGVVARRLKDLADDLADEDRAEAHRRVEERAAQLQAVRDRMNALIADGSAFAAEEAAKRPVLVGAVPGDEAAKIDVLTAAVDAVEQRERTIGPTNPDELDAAWHRYQPIHGSLGHAPGYEDSEYARRLELAHRVHAWRQSPRGRICDALAALDDTRWSNALDLLSSAGFYQDSRLNPMIDHDESMFAEAMKLAEHGAPF